MHQYLFPTLFICVFFSLPVMTQDSTVVPSPNTIDSSKGEIEVSPADSSSVDTSLSSISPNTKSGSASFGEKTRQGLSGRTRNSIKRIIRTLFGYLRYFLFIVIGCGIVLLTVTFYRRRKEGEYFLTSTRLSVMDREVQFACKYMEENYNNSDLTIESMCEQLVTGPAFLEALFEKELGMSVSEFLTQVRINRAKIILQKRPDYEPYDVALDVGFTDNKHFLSTFKKITGLTFEEYRNANQYSHQSL